MRVHFKPVLASLVLLFLVSHCMIVSGIGSILQSDNPKSDNSLFGLLALAGGSGRQNGDSSTPTVGSGGGQNGNWSQQAYLKAPNAEANDQFGYSVSISGDTIVVGAIYEDSNQTTITNGATASSNNIAVDSGAAYVFVRSGSNWSHQAYLKAPNAEAGDVFGYSVSISGDTIVVGANFEASNQTTITNGATASSNNSADDSGAAYVFVRSGSNWSNQAYLKAPNAEASDYFGYSAISGDTIVVGAIGEASNQTTITNGATKPT
ncbi:MAG: FG-GAP repeat protein [Leptospiraceae bacterium]|nr:FG-GAP repeat protein [Leptospiraceae bacterium]